MIDVNGIIDDEMDDVEDSEDTYDETGELVVNISRAPKVKPRQAILQLGHKTRARFVENNPNIFLEVKIESKTDNEDNFRNCGYFGTILGLLEYGIDENPKEKLFNKKEIITMEEMRDILLESQRQAQIQADDIVYSINNNTYLKEVSDEALSR